MNTIKYRAVLEKAGVKLCSVSERLTGEAGDILLESLYEGMAEYYSVNLGQEVLKVLKQNALKAKFNGGIPPLGYDIDDDKNYVINEEEAIIVKRIFQMVLDGMTYGQIIKEFQDCGYKTKHNKSFAKNSLHSILRNERYKGTYVYNKTMRRRRDGTRNRHQSKAESEIIRVEGAIPSIVSADDFNEVQRILDARKRNGASSKAKQVDLLQGIIYCGECGSAMHGNRRKNGSGEYYISYRCGCKKSKMKCANKEIRREHIEEYVISILRHHLLSSNNINRLVNQVNQAMYMLENRKDESAIELEKELEMIDSKIENLVVAIEKSGGNQTLFDRLSELETRKRNVEHDIKSNKKILESKKINSDDIVETFSAYKRIINDNDRQAIKDIIRKFITRISVYKDRIDIEFNTVFSMGSMPVYMFEPVEVAREDIRLMMAV